MVGGIKPSSPGVKSMSADMFLDLLTMSAPSGEERTPNASAQVERAGWCCRRSDSGMHTCCGRATVMVLVSSSSDRPRRRGGPAGSASDPGARAEMARPSGGKTSKTATKKAVKRGAES